MRKLIIPVQIWTSQQGVVGAMVNRLSPKQRLNVRFIPTPYLYLIKRDTSEIMKKKKLDPIEKMRKTIGFIEPMRKKELDKNLRKYFKTTKNWVWEITDEQGGYTFEDEEHARILSKLLEIEQMLKKRK